MASKSDRVVAYRQKEVQITTKVKLTSAPAPSDYHYMRNLILAAILVSSCHSKTVLDIESCFGDAVANAAAPLLGVVSGILLDAGAKDEAVAGIESLGIKYGVAAVTCALDTVIRDLGGNAAKPRTTTMGATPSAAQRAVSYGHEARAKLLKPATTKK